jgi:sodium transport system permease protein
MNRIAVIMKKEFTRFFSDRRMVFSVLILPALLIFLMNTVTGKLLTDADISKTGERPLVFAVFPPEPVLAAAEEAGFLLAPLLPEQRERVMKNIAGREDLLLAVFPPDFEEAAARYQFIPGTRQGPAPPEALTSDDAFAGGHAVLQGPPETRSPVRVQPGPAPLVELYYNSSSAASLNAFSRFQLLLGDYENSLVNKFDVNTGSGYDLASDRDFTGSLLASVVPLLMIVFMSVGALSLAVDAIAGEKERGTMTALLVTPVRHTELAAGKVLGIAFLSFLSGLCLAAGILPSMISRLNGAVPESGGPAFNLGVYGFGDYALFVPILFSTVLLIVTAFSLVAVWAKTMKEASLLALPVELLITFCAIFALLKNNSTIPWYHYLIPFYNSALCVSDILTFNVRALCILPAVLGNCVLASAGILLLAKAFGSERIMFH